MHSRRNAALKEPRMSARHWGTSVLQDCRKVFGFPMALAEVKDMMQRPESLVMAFIM